MRFILFSTIIYTFISLAIVLAEKPECRDDLVRPCDCPIANYDSTGGAAERLSDCASCPGGYTTESSGSTSKTQCSVPCYGGSYRPDNVRYTCQPCTIGTYSEVGSKNCEPCPEGTTNYQEGRAFCECNQGEYSTQGIGPNLYNSQDIDTCTSCPPSTDGRTALLRETDEYNGRVSTGFTIGPDARHGHKFVASAPKDQLNSGVGDAIIYDQGIVFVGAPYTKCEPPIEGARTCGRVFIFLYDEFIQSSPPSAMWEQLTMTPPNQADAGDDYFGRSIDIMGDLLAIGSPGLQKGRGGVVLYKPDPSETDGSRRRWVEVQTVMYPHEIAGESPLFGISLAIAADSNMVIVGAANDRWGEGCDPSVAPIGCGTVYLLRRNQETDVWTVDDSNIYIEPDGRRSSNGFGSSMIRASANRLIVSAPAGFRARSIGRAYVYEVLAGELSYLHSFTSEVDIIPNPVGFAETIAAAAPYYAFEITYDNGLDRAVIVYEETTTGSSRWVVRSVIKSPYKLDNQQNWGTKIAMTTDTLLISNENELDPDGKAPISGAVRVHSRDYPHTNAWGEIAPLFPNDPSTFEGFSSNLWINEQVILATARSTYDILCPAYQCAAVYALPAPYFQLEETCVPCAPGTYYEAGSSTCTPCPMGTFSSTWGALQCEPCYSGSFLNTTGAASIDECIPCSNGGVTSAQGSVNEDTDCQLLCDPGSYREPGALGSCKSCPAGTRGLTTGAGSILDCELCPIGSSSPSGSTSCTTCPPGDTTFQAGSLCECDYSSYSVNSFGPLEEIGTCFPCGPGQNGNKVDMRNEYGIQQKLAIATTVEFDARVELHGDTHFGDSVSSSNDGSVIAIGAPYDCLDWTKSYCGVGLVYVRSPGGDAVLSPTGSEDHRFGFDVDVSADGKTIIVGDPGRSGPCPDDYDDCGSAHIFEADDDWSAWTLVSKVAAPLEPDSRTFTTFFGSKVKIRGDTVLVGCPKCSQGTPVSGAVYAYQYYPFDGIWMFSGLLTAPLADAQAQGGYGSDFDINEAADTIWVGAQATQYGRVYGYSRKSGDDFRWNLQLSLPRDDEPIRRDKYTRFGEAVALTEDGKTLIIGASNDLNTVTEVNSGAVFIYEKDYPYPDAWGLVKKLYPFEANTVEYFGSEVDIYEDTAIVGAMGDRSECPGSDVLCGAVYLFVRNFPGTDAWGYVGKYVSANNGLTRYGMEFGAHVSLSQQGFLVGAPDDTSDDRCISQSGACGRVYAATPFDINPRLTCSDCLPGSYSNGTIGIKNCSACSAGSYQPSYGADSCISCPQGTYGPETGASDLSQCIPCPAGKTTAESGQSSDSSCSIECPVATYREPSTWNTCLPCPKGTWSSDSGLRGPEECNPCDPGHTTLELGSTNPGDCTIECPMGTYRPLGYIGDCIACPAGTFSTDTAAVSKEGSCKPCEKDSSSPAGASSCSACGIGLGTFGEGQTCECAFNTYSTVSFANDQLCGLCGPGEDGRFAESRIQGTVGPAMFLGPQSPYTSQILRTPLVNTTDTSYGATIRADLEAGWLLIGAPQADSTETSTTWVGAAYLYSSSYPLSMPYNLVHTFTPLKEKFLGLFGSTLDLWFTADSSHGTVVIAAPDDPDCTGSQCGVVETFDFTPLRGWKRTQKILAYDSRAYDNFGGSIVVSERLLIVGAPETDNGQGTVYLYSRGSIDEIDRSWTVAARRLSATVNTGPVRLGFGASLAYSAKLQMLFVGAPGYYDSEVEGPQTGAVWTFLAPAPGRLSQWTPSQSPIVPPADGSVDYFGRSIAVGAEGSRLVIGAPTYPDSHARSSVLAYSGRLISRGGDAPNDGESPVYEWTLTNIFREDDSPYVSAHDVPESFGTSLSLSADASTLAIGTSTPARSSETTQKLHVDVYHFDDPVGGWSLATSIFAHLDLTQIDYMNVAFSPHTLIVTANGYTADSDNPNAGATYVTTVEKFNHNQICVACEPGYASKSGAIDDRCTACPKGQYATNPGSLACDICPAGSYGPEEASERIEGCLLCAKGTSSTPGSASCYSCGDDADSLADGFDCECSAGFNGHFNPGLEGAREEGRCQACALGSELADPSQVRYDGVTYANFNLTTENSHRIISKGHISFGSIFELGARLLVTGDPYDRAVNGVCTDPAEKFCGSVSVWKKDSIINKELGWTEIRKFAAPARYAGNDRRFGAHISLVEELDLLFVHAYQFRASTGEYIGLLQVPEVGDAIVVMDGREITVDANSEAVLIGLPSYRHPFSTSKAPGSVHMFKPGAGGVSQVWEHASSWYQGSIDPNAVGSLGAAVSVGQGLVAMSDTKQGLVRVFSSEVPTALRAVFHEFEPESEFGGKIDIESDVLIVSARKEDNRGAVHIYTSNSSNEWLLHKSLFPVRFDGSDVGVDTYFGSDIEYEKGLLLISSVEVGAETGDAYLYSRNWPTGNSFGLISKLEPGNIFENYFQFGSGVSISSNGRTIAIGADGFTSTSIFAVSSEVYSHELNCLSCPRGSYRNEKTLGCVSCPLGYYSSFEGAIECLPCEDSITLQEGSTSINDCTPCNDGEVPADDNSKCIPDSSFSSLPTAIGISFAIISLLAITTIIVKRSQENTKQRSKLLQDSGFYEMKDKA